jgi:hypothetical protein
VTLPTKFIDNDEFEELMNQEDGVIPLFLLAAVPFLVGAPEEEWPILPDLPEVNVLLLNVAEPVLYREASTNKGFVILPGFNIMEYTYKDFEEIHPVKAAWGYRLAPNGWEEGDWDYGLTSAIYVFDHGEVDEWVKPGD